VHPVDALNRLGGVASYRALRGLCTRASIDRCVESGDVLRTGRGRYALAVVGDAVRIAHATSGVVSHLSAALHLGWEVKTPPDRVHVTVPRGRRTTTLLRTRCVPHRAPLTRRDVDGLVTTPERTLVDCLRTLPEDEGLCVADSALRHRTITYQQLELLVADIRGPGADRARRVARLADRRAANPFESVLRHLCLQVPGLDVVPQLDIVGPDFVVSPDLVDAGLGVAIEADSQRWHNSSRAQLRRDCRRYTALVVRGWLVVRFAWEDVMFEPDYVLEELAGLVATARRLPQDRLTALPSA
jgi:very-short-patch-repair endonuclease